MLRAGSLFQGQQATCVPRHFLGLSRRPMSDAATKIIEEWESGRIHDESGGAESEALTGDVPPAKDNRGAISYHFGSINFLDRKSKSLVKQDIAWALAHPDQQQFAAKAIRACGGRWYDTSRVYKSNVLSRFMQTYLNKTKLTRSLGNALLVSYAENSKDFDSKTILKSFMDAGIQPTHETYSAIIRLEAARGNFKSACEVFDFCKKQSLQVSDSALYSLLTGSIAHSSPELTAEIENKLSEQGDGSGILPNLAKALGHSALGDLKGIERVLLSEYSISESTVDENYLFTQACCLLYQGLAESESGTKKTTKFIDMLSDFDLKSVPLYESNLNLTSAHLYANGFVDHSIKLKNAIDEASSELPLESQSPDRIFMSSMVNNNKEPVDVFINKLQSIKFEAPLGNWLQLDTQYGHKGSDVATVMEHYIKKPEVGEVRPQFYFPAMIVADKANPTPPKLITEFHECLADESEDLAVHSIAAFEQVMVTNVRILDSMLGSGELVKYPRSQCAVIRALLFHNRFNEAVQVAEKTDLTEVLATDLLNLYASVITKLYFPASDMGRLLTHALRSVSTDEQESFMRKIAFFLCLSSRARPRLDRGIHLANYLSDKGIYMNEFELKSFSLTDDTLSRVYSEVINTMLHPEAILKPGQFSNNVRKIPAETIAEMVEKLNSEDCGISDEKERAVKRMILNACVDNFDELDALLDASDVSQEMIRSYFSARSTVNLMLQCLADRNSIERAVKLMSAGRFGTDFMVYQTFLKSVKTREDMLMLLNQPLDTFVAGPNLGSTTAMIEDFLEDKEVDSVLAELVDSRYNISAKTSLLRNAIREHKEGKKTLEELKSTYDQLVEKGMRRKTATIFLIAACLKEPNNPSAKELLKVLIQSEGTVEQSEFKNGEIILATLENGDYSGAVEMGANKVSGFTQKDFIRTISSKREVDLFSALFRIEGRVVWTSKEGETRMKRVPTGLCFYLKELYSTGSDEERQFVVDVVRRVVTEDKPKIPAFVFPQIEQLASLVGIKVPEDYRQRYMTHSEAALQSLVSEGDLGKIMDFIAKSEGDVDCSAQTLESIVKLIELVDANLCTKKSFLKLLAKNSQRLIASTVIRDLIMMTNWAPAQFENLTKAVMSSEMRDVHRRLVAASSLSPRRNLYLPKALVGYLAANPDDVGYVRNTFFRKLERASGANGIIAMLITCARLPPERLNATEAIREQVLSKMVEEIRKSNVVDNLSETLEDFGTRFNVPKDVIGSITAKITA